MSDTPTTNRYEATIDVNYSMTGPSVPEIRCPNCGNLVGIDNAIECWACGASLTLEVVIEDIEDKHATVDSKS